MKPLHSYHPNRFLLNCCTIIACSYIWAISTGCSTIPASSLSTIDVRAKDLLTVDCLLPPQVRQLGTNATYLGPRRPLRTTGNQCALRGGEYVAYNRADFKSALAVWLPLAEKGDPQAQTYVGEIHEKGMGTRASYELAALWYERAAQQNYSRAQINLGYLYESGLGVQRDLPRALNLYRSAAGFTSAELDFVSSVEVAERRAAAQRTERLQSDLLMLRTSISEGRRELHLKSDKLKQSQQEIDKLRNTLRTHPSIKAQTSTDTARLQDKTNETEKTVQNTNRIQQLRAELETSQSSLALQQADSQRQVATLQNELDVRETAFAEQSRSIASLRKELLQWQASLPPDAVEQTIETVSKGPVINIIDPPLLSTRGVSTLAVSGRSDLIGKVEPAAKLFAFRINGDDLPVTPTGLFRYDMQSDRQDTLDLLAVNDKGESTRLSLTVASGAKAPVESISMKPAVAPMPASVEFNKADFGFYHALVIGNDNYDNMGDLKTAVNDAREVERILREKYGFRTTLLINANQRTLLSALERMRATLHQMDNLLIYYAGHGELDKHSGRGYWLPVDARADTKDHWIANSAITAMIDLMKAKHVLVIADSCYSGTLTRSSVARALPATSAALRLKWLKAVSGVKVRTVLSSGSINPVLDGSPGSEHSIFAEQLITALQSNTQVLEAYELFFQLQDPVTTAAALLDMKQTPQYAPIRHAGHQAGEFIFLPLAQSSIVARPAMNSRPR